MIIRLTGSNKVLSKSVHDIRNQQALEFLKSDKQL